MKTYDLQFEAAPARHFDKDVNILHTFDDDTLYAECIWPEGTEEDFGYFALKDAIIELAAAHGIAAEQLHFQYDGQEQYLSADAKAAASVYTEYEEEEDD